jgi:hypothetical protein
MSLATQAKGKIPSSTGDVPRFFEIDGLREAKNSGEARSVEVEMRLPRSNTIKHRATLTLTMPQ